MEDTKADLEKVLEDNEGKYTEEEKIAQIEQAQSIYILFQAMAVNGKMLFVGGGTLSTMIVADKKRRIK